MILKNKDTKIVFIVFLPYWLITKKPSLSVFYSPLAAVSNSGPHLSCHGISMDVTNSQRTGPGSLSPVGLDEMTTLLANRRVPLDSLAIHAMAPLVLCLQVIRPRPTMTIYTTNDVVGSVSSSRALIGHPTTGTDFRTSRPRICRHGSAPDTTPSSSSVRTTDPSFTLIKIVMFFISFGSINKTSSSTKLYVLTLSSLSLSY